MTLDASHLTARVRRLSRAGDQLYVQFDRRELDRHQLRHLTEVTLTIGEDCQVGGVIKTSGGTPWLAPGDRWSNRSITTVLRRSGLDHGDDVPATVQTLNGTRRPSPTPAHRVVRTASEKRETNQTPTTDAAPSSDATRRLARRVEELARKRVRLWHWDPYVLGESPVLESQILEARHAARIELERWRTGRFPSLQLAVADAVFSKQKKYRTAVLSAIRPFAIAWGDKPLPEFCVLPWPTVYERVFGHAPGDPDNAAHNHLSLEGRIQTILAAARKLQSLGFATTNDLRETLTGPGGRGVIRDQLLSVRGLGDALVSNIFMNVGDLQAKVDTHVRGVVHECTGVPLAAGAEEMLTAIEGAAGLLGLHEFEVDQIIWYAMAEPE